MKEPNERVLLSFTGERKRKETSSSALSDYAYIASSSIWTMSEEKHSDEDNNRQEFSSLCVTNLPTK
jgi:hypothetical protein